MQVEEIEINGFKIDEFNQHKLEVGKTQGVCPTCSHTRKPKNKNAKCASYDWGRGLGIVITVIQLFNYTRINVKVIAIASTFALQHKS